MPERYLGHDGWMEEANDEAAEQAERQASKPTFSPLVLIRDGTIFGAGRTEIDFRTPDYSAWLTIKAEDDAVAEAIAAALEDKFGTEGGTARQSTAKAASVGSPARGASSQGEVGAE